ncbi:MAG: prepilin-type N-terminal cleavage/methylation domain-containing protein [Methylococcaceae bacterium]|nr:prepilin-type N-terminal cleavage/methylation domain-containing protein [Methylococcaceae bacterium]
MTARHRFQEGVTLIELILSMVIISIAVVGIFSVINLTTRHSADPVVNYQAIAIAESYMDEILLQAYADPDGINAGETRASFDDVSDYNGLTDVGARNQQGALISNLSRYTVEVVVSAPVALTGGVSAKKISVSVSGQGLSGLALVGYKTDY